jgi:hypothetical protein
MTKPRNVPVKLAIELRGEGCAWRDVVQELAWTTGRVFTADGVAAACRRAEKAKLERRDQ